MRKKVTNEDVAQAIAKLRIKYVAIWIMSLGWRKAKCGLQKTIWWTY